MRCLSTVRVKTEDDWIEYLSKKKFVSQKGFLAKLLGCTTKTIDNKDFLMCILVVYISSNWLFHHITLTKIGKLFK